MSEIDSVQKNRVVNLKFLQGLSALDGAPTSKNFISHLASKNVNISQKDLSDIYCKNKTFDFFLAKSIEQSLALPDGWLSYDQTYFLNISPKDVSAIKVYSQLPDDIKKHISAILFSLANSIGLED
ncbi:hypothetical protein LWH48_06495 [Halomonas sp. G15]|uniref:hypothetical protein n=1 Tax=Halomonas sp. G15 TaxID=2903521 RepID=UPI001E31D1A5|nr:hypothetical protein [Halomonas sp. G15]MCE0732451.1 hypothetical protein [Halomonas sp. G15]